MELDAPREHGISARRGLHALVEQIDDDAVHSFASTARGERTPRGDLPWHTPEHQLYRSELPLILGMLGHPGTQA